MSAAFAEQVEAVGGPVIGGASAEQLDLLRGADGKLPRDAFLRARAGGPGRRPGSRNKRNTDLAKLICQKAGDPALFLASVYATPLDQLVELLLIAEGVPEREERLLALCDTAAALLATAVREQWSEERLKSATKACEAIERAASALKSKPGETALRALGHQITAAKEVAPYVHSKKPTEVAVTEKLDGVIFMPAPQASAADPIEQVMRRTVEAVNRGDIDPGRIQDMRFVDGAFVPADEDGDDGDGDGEDAGAPEEPA